MWMGTLPTRQRFVSLEFDYPDVDTEARIIAHESRVDGQLAGQLALISEKVRNLREQGFEEGVSTRLLVYAGQLAAGGISAKRACEVAIAQAVSDDADIKRAIDAIINLVLP